MKVRKVFALSILTTSIALAAGCSSDDDDEPTPMTEMPGTGTPGTEMPGTGTPGTETPGTEMPGTEMPVADTSTTMGNSIVDIARGTSEEDGTEITPANPDLTTLTGTLANYPDLINLLDAEGTFTVFAPNDAAFEGEDLGEDADAIRNVLNYHVITDQVVNTGALTAEQTLPLTLNTASTGNTLTLQDDGTGNIVVVDSDGSEVSVGEAVVADNGVVYIIDELLTAPAAAAEPGETEDPGDNTTDTGAGGGGGGDAAVEGSTFAAIQDDDSLSDFEDLVVSSNYSLNLQDEANNEFVVFAPVNGSVETLSSEVTDYIAVREEGTSGPVTSDETFNGATGSLTFEVGGTGAGGDLTVNGLPAEFVTTQSGGALIKYGSAAE